MKQTERVLDYIHQFGSISSYEAFIDLGIVRLASRIHDLRKEGYEFKVSWIKKRNRFGDVVTFKQYRLVNLFDYINTTK